MLLSPEWLARSIAGGLTSVLPTDLINASRHGRRGQSFFLLLLFQKEQSVCVYIVTQRHTFSPEAFALYISSFVLFRSVSADQLTHPELRSSLSLPLSVLVILRHHYDHG